MQLGDRFRGIEVIIHRRLEALRMRLVPVDLRFPHVSASQGSIEPAERLLRIIEVAVGVADRAAVLRAHEEEAHHLGVVALQHLADGEEVAERLRHLLVGDAHEAVVQPVAHEGLAVRALGLRDLVLVVRKLQVLAAAMEVESLPQQGAAHGRALDVPARASVAPRRRPCGLAGLGALPEHEVQGIVLAGSGLDALAGAQFIQRLARELAVAGKLAHREVDVAVVRLVGERLLLEPADELLHLRNVVGSARLVVGLLDAESADVLVHRAHEPLDQRGGRLTVLGSALDDLVFDIGDISHVGDAIAARAQPAPYHVEGDHHAAVAKVAVVVDGHAAHVHAHLARTQRNEVLLVPRQRVVDPEHAQDPFAPAESC